MTRINSSTLNGLICNEVQIESYLSNHLPTFQIIGLANKAIDESKDRIRSAFAQSNIDFPRKRIVINLTPADLPKKGSCLDLAISATILLNNINTSIDPDTHSFVGELSLSGEVRPVRGILSHIESAAMNGKKTIVISANNYEEAKLARNIRTVAVSSLKDLKTYLETGNYTNPAASNAAIAKTSNDRHYDNIVGQNLAKRALAIAAAGGHNLMLEGPPGGGKSLLARSLIELMPDMDEAEIYETTKIYSSHTHISEPIQIRPFRHPHHSSSHISVVGGGATPSPGEITLAHKGVLFLDEIAEFDRRTLESLRQPLEDKKISISRANYKVDYPADFVLVCTQNPCPCGNLNSSKSCLCSMQSINSYQAKLSGPVRDRIDLYTYVTPSSHKKLLTKPETDVINVVRKSINSARKIQLSRQGCLNSHLTSPLIKELGMLSSSAQSHLIKTADSLKLSTRSFIKLIKVSLTIADLEQSKLQDKHIDEALTYRNRDTQY